jgi:uncharacterized membrane protein
MSANRPAVLSADGKLGIADDPQPHGTKLNSAPGASEPAIARRTMVMRSEYYQGPIADPARMAAYAEIDPTLPDRIVKMAEKAQDRIEKRADLLVQSEIDDRRRGMWMGFGLLLTVIGAACGLAIKGHDGVAAAVLLLGSAGLAGVFVNGRGSQNVAPKGPPASGNRPGDND